MTLSIITHLSLIGIRILTTHLRALISPLRSAAGEGKKEKAFFVALNTLEQKSKI